MTVETPKLSDASPTPSLPKPKAPASDTVKVKAVGEGAIGAENPFDRWLPSYTPEEYEPGAAAPSAVPGTLPGVAGAPNKPKAKSLVDRAKEFIGTPYKWGGTGPLGFDCSGFTQYLYRELGINLPRVSAQQGQFGPKVGLDKLQPGDLVFWDNSSRNVGADHVAIYLGDGKVIHAPKPGDAVKISTIWDAGSAWGVAMNL